MTPSFVPPPIFTCHWNDCCSSWSWYRIRKHGVRILYQDQLEQQSFQWQVKIGGGTKLGVIPDRVFALEYADQYDQMQRAYFFLEADRGTMPVTRHTLSQTSFYRKL